MKVLFRITFLFMVLFLIPTGAFSKSSIGSLGYKFTASKSKHNSLKVLIDKTGSKLRLKAERGDIMLLPPYKFKIVLNPENKLYMPVYLFGIGPTEERLVPIGKISKPVKTKLLNLNCRKYLFKVRNPGREILKATVVATDDLKFAYGLSQAFYGVLGLKGMKGFPLSYTAVSKDGKQRIVFKVDKIDKAKVDRSQFLIPSNYKRAKSFAALIFSEDGKFGKDELNDFFRSKF